MVYTREVLRSKIPGLWDSVTPMWVFRFVLSLLSLANMLMLTQVGTSVKRELERTRVWNSVKM